MRSVFEHFVKHLAQSGGAGVAFIVGVHCAGGLRKLVGEIERGEHGNAQGIDCAAVRRDGAHLAVDQIREMADVVGILAAQMIRLVVDADAWCNRERCRAGFRSPFGTSHFKCVKLGKQALNALAHLIAFGVESAHFFLQSS